MPSSPQTRHLIAKDIRDNNKHSNPLKIYDLGSGWGGLCRKLAKNKQNAVISGYEISIIPFLYSKIVSYIDVFRIYNIFRADLFTIDIKQADIVICYLSPYHIQRFETELLQQMKKGSMLYSQGFALQNKKPSYIINAPFSLEKNIYCYLIK